MMNLVRVSRQIPLDAEAAQARADWSEVLSNDEADIRVVIDTAGEAAKSQDSLWRVWAWVLYQGVYRWKGRYIEESDIIARHMSCSASALAFLQRGYTWSHVGCTTAVVWDGREMWHLRCLDWGEDPGDPKLGFAEVLARATRQFAFTYKGKVLFRTAGISGMIGVLTGLKPGVFSVVVNYAPWKTWSAHLRPDPTFLVRELLADAAVSSYASARSTVAAWEPSCPVFISICGTREGEGVVIEFGSGGRAGHVRELGTKNIIVQGNHFFPGSPFTGNNSEQVSAPKPGKTWDDYPLDDTSDKRCTLLEQYLVHQLAAGSVDWAIAFEGAYSQVPIFNSQTAQWVLMQPSTGRMDIWARSP